MMNMMILKDDHTDETITHIMVKTYMIPLTFNFVHWNYNFTPSYTLLVLLSVDYDNQGLGGGGEKNKCCLHARQCQTEE